MKRKLTSILLMSALLVGGASTFVSCKDYDGDQAAVTNANVKGLSDKLNEQIAALEAVRVDLAKKADKTYVDDLIADIDETIADLTDVVNGHTEKLIEVEAAIVDIDGRLGNLEDFEGQVKSLFGENLENVLLKGSLADYAAGEGASDFLGAMVASLNNAIAAAGTKQFTNVEELFKYLDETIPAKLKNLSDSCAMIAGRDSLLNSRIDSLVQSVNVDMVSNPIYGTFNTPFGVKNYVLAGFVGGEVKKVNVGGKVISSNGKLASSLDGGNLYLTINPAEVDATGWNIGKLVGRDGSYAPGYGDLILAADDTPVTTITTRASNGLGGYVATPELEDAAAAKINIDKDALKDVAKNVLGKLRRQEALDITQNVYTIYNQFAHAIDQYYAVKCQVKEKDAFGEVKTRTIVSDYNIAAVTIKPLSYTTNIGKVGEKVNIPSIPAFENLLGIEIKNVNIDPVTAHIDDFTFTVVDGSYLNFNKVVVEKEADGTGTIDMPLYSYEQRYVVPFTSCEAEPVFENGVQVAIMYTVHIAQDANKIITDLNNQLASVEGQVNTTLGSVKDALNKAGKYYNKVAPKLNKVISKVNYILDNANQLLQPIMLGVADGDAFRLSEVKDAPTVVKANGENAIVLAPTSYTLELLAPAYKKSIKVNGTQLNDANLDGTTKTVVANLKSGLNTIEYSTMDFYGNVVNKNYYIYVK